MALFFNTEWYSVFIDFRGWNKVASVLIKQCWNIDHKIMCPFGIASLCWFAQRIQIISLTLTLSLKPQASVYIHLTIKAKTVLILINCDEEVSRLIVEQLLQVWLFRRVIIITAHKTVNYDESCFIVFDQLSAYFNLNITMCLFNFYIIKRLNK